MSYKCYEVTKIDALAMVNMCRPEKANSMNEDFWRELPQILEVPDHQDKPGDDGCAGVINSVTAIAITATQRWLHPSNSTRLSGLEFST